jgi:hypothetical protein
MRLLNLAAFSFLLFALLAIEAYAMQSGSSGLSADQLIDVSNGKYPSWGEQGSPKEARARWNAQNDNDYETPAQSSDESKSTVEASKSSGAKPAEDVAGSWSFSLRDIQNKIMALTISQSDGTLFGTGSISEANGTETVSASGFVNGNKISLNVTAAETLEEYILTLTKASSTASGKYTLFPSVGETLNGTAEGVLLNSA